MDPNYAYHLLYRGRDRSQHSSWYTTCYMMSAETMPYSVGPKNSRDIFLVKFLVTLPWKIQVRAESTSLLTITFTLRATGAPVIDTTARYIPIFPALDTLSAVVAQTIHLTIPMTLPSQYYYCSCPQF